MTSLATVIIPTYNRAYLLLRALDSVKAQNYRPIEVLVVDDGSTDDTAELVQQWSNENADTLLKYTFKENGGPSSCRNIGIRQANGDYIYFLDSDDYMHSNLLTDAIRVLLDEQADCVLFGFEWISPMEDTGKTWLPPDQPALKSFFENSLWGYTSASLKRADLVQETGLWNEKTSFGEDHEYLGRSLLNSRKTVVLQKALLTVTRSGESLGSRKDSKEGLEHRLVAEKSLIDEIMQRKTSIPGHLLAAYSDRLIKTAINMHAKGEGDFARELGRLAFRVHDKPDSALSSIKRIVWKQGRWACWIWLRLLQARRIARIEN